MSIITPYLESRNSQIEMKLNKKYLELVKQYHPDRNPDADQSKFKNITAAYTVLSNETTKVRYDISRREGTSFGSSNQHRSSHWKNYAKSPGYDSTNDYSNFYENSKDKYQRNHQYKKSQEAYRQWFQEAQRRKREQEFERQQYSKGKQYHSYDEFKRDFEKQDSRNYQQNWNYSSDRQAREDFEREWSSMRDEYHGDSLHKMRQSFMQLYWKIVLLMIFSLIVESIYRNLKQIERQKNILK